MIDVSLTADEGLAAATVGALQMMRAIRTNRVGFDHGGRSGRSMRERWAQAIHGAMAECAGCKAFGVFWAAGVSGINGDDGGGYQFRATPWPDGHLIVNEADVEKWADSTFVLITGHWPDFRVVWSILGRDARASEWFRPDEKPASYWVPQTALRPATNDRTA